LNRTRDHRAHVADIRQLAGSVGDGARH
jgi:hypothetical protein